MKKRILLGLSVVMGLTACSQAVEDKYLDSRWYMTGDHYQIADIALPAFTLEAGEQAGTYKIAGTTGCNNFFGSATISNNELVVNQPMGMTRKLCGDTANKIEMEFIQALEQPLSIDGEQLKLSNGATMKRVPR